MERWLPNKFVVEETYRSGAGREVDGYCSNTAIINPDPESIIYAVRVLYGPVSSPEVALAGPTEEGQYRHLNLIPQNYTSTGSPDALAKLLKEYGIRIGLSSGHPVHSSVLKVFSASMILPPPEYLDLGLEPLGEALSQNNTRIAKLILPAVEKLLKAETVDLLKLDRSLDSIARLFRENQPGWGESEERDR